MQDQLRDLWARPSRLVGWGVVALIHLLMWQVLSRSLNVSEFAPALESVQVTLMDQEPPATPPQPQLPKVVLPMVTETYVPVPEVAVVRESAPQVTVTSIIPVAATPEHSAVAPVAVPSTRLLVVTESEVDYVVRPEIRYPLAAKRAKEQGTVLLSVIVDEHGLVRHISVYQSSGYRRLDYVALKAMRALRVQPYVRNGAAQSIEIRVPVEFSLSSAV